MEFHLNKSKMIDCKDKKNKKNCRIYFAILAIIGMIYIVVNIYRSYHGIQITQYEIASNKISKPMNVVIIGDLHDRQYGTDNIELISMVLNQKPDAVLMVGDMLNDNSKSTEVVENLVRELSNSVPVYYAMGNHELKWERTQKIDLSAIIEDAGAIILNENYVDITINEQEVRLGGLYSYSYPQSYDELDLNDISNISVRVFNYFTEFQETNQLKILLSHRPDSFATGNASEMWNVDLVVSGHLHGGQIVLPLLGGVLGGTQGLFPTYVHGLYEKDKVQLLITNGLGSKPWGMPRWNNPPEIVVLKIVP